MYKKDVSTVAQPLLDDMEQQLCLSSDFNVYAVSGPLSGKQSITVSPDASTGSGFGLSRAAPLGGCASFLVTVLPHLVALRTAGLNKCRRNKLTIPRYSM